MGLRSAKRILDLTKELDISVKDVKLVINRAPNGIDQLKKEIDVIGIPYAGAIPNDEEIFKLSVENKNIMTLAQDTKAHQAVSKIYEEVLWPLNK